MFFYSQEYKFSNFKKWHIWKTANFYWLKYYTVIVLAAFKVFLLLNIKTYIVITELFYNLKIFIYNFLGVLTWFYNFLFLCFKFLNFFHVLLYWRRWFTYCTRRFWFWFWVLMHWNIFISNKFVFRQLL